VAGTRAQQVTKVDSLMELASVALVERRYFDAERLAADALARAFTVLDYERMTRILLPLEEARRHKRDAAAEAGHVAVVSSQLPTGRGLRAGCYLVSPPRVGIDGRSLREAADRKKVPVIVVVREPTSRDGLWPVVALGPVTVRTKVPPPEGTSNGAAAPATRRGKKKAGKGDEGPDAPARVPEPPVQWFLRTCELLGDAAIAGVDRASPADLRVETLLRRLEAHPDHEKLHQALGDACREAMLGPEPGRKARRAEIEF
jgi:hypothetical protein